MNIYYNYMTLRIKQKVRTKRNSENWREYER